MFLSTVISCASTLVDNVLHPTIGGRHGGLRKVRQYFSLTSELHCLYLSAGKLIRIVPQERLKTKMGAEWEREKWNCSEIVSNSSVSQHFI